MFIYLYNFVYILEWAVLSFTTQYVVPINGVFNNLLLPG